jgi:hypothetical protein
MSGCDTVFYQYGKSRASVLRTLGDGSFWRWFSALDENSATDSELTAVGQQFFAALYE